MYFQSRPFRAAHLRLRLNAIAQAVLASSVASFITVSAARAEVIYLPPCNGCAISSGPAAGDEWVVQGTKVRAIGSFASFGTLTNQANALTNRASLSLSGPLGALVNQKSLINESLISLGHPSARLVNQDTFQNNGSIVAPIGLIDNIAGRFTNSGTIQAGDRLRNRIGAQFINNGDIDLGQMGRVDNDQGAVLRNAGRIHGYLSAQVNNYGTVRNLSGGDLSPDTIWNRGTVINDAGGTIAQRLFRAEAGSVTVNHGVINNDRDGAFTLAAGSSYDFTGGTFNNGFSSQLILGRDFTFGDAKGGTVNLGASGSVHNHAHAKVAEGYTQASLGGFFNDGQFTNQGSFQVKGPAYFLNAAAGTVTNEGTLETNDEGRIVNGGRFINKGGLFILRGAFENSQGGTLDNSGTIGFGIGKLINKGTIDNTGNIRLDASSYDFTGGTLHNRKNGLLTLESSFVFGAPKSGTLVLDKGGRLDTTSSLTNAAGHIQVNSGEIQIGYAPLTNEKGATFVNNGLVSMAGSFRQNGTWIGTGTFEHVESSMEVTGVMVQDTVRLQFGRMTISQGGVLTARHVDGGMASVHLDGGTINSQNDVGIDSLTVEGGGGLINANLRVYEPLRVKNTSFVVNGNLSLSGFLEQTGDGAVSSFGDLVIGSYGYINASGNILVSGDFINHGSGARWSTTQAGLSLLGQGKHEIALAGRDLGATAAGLAADNFAWKDVVFGDEGQWSLTDGDSTAGAALYARHLSFLGGLGGIKELSGNYNIYYDPTAAGNEIFRGQTYAFGSGTGKVIAVSSVPEPGPMALCLAGVAVLLQRQRARSRRG